MLHLCCCLVDSQMHPTFLFTLFMENMLAKWWALDSWAMNLTSVSLQDVCNRKKGIILQWMINSWLCWKRHKIFPVLSMVNTWKDDRSTHSSSDLYVNNNRQHQALEVWAETPKICRAAGLKPFYVLKIMTLYVAQGTHLLERYMEHEQAQRVVVYVLSQGNLQML